MSKLKKVFFIRCTETALTDIFIPSFSFPLTSLILSDYFCNKSLEMKQGLFESVEMDRLI